ncbi:hypothetical protein [Kitasatospora sp. NPDC098663]|uniref:hypothetical protein n=1 Tax=Kitasatospora sp. NPDC098663 TaxID=3364096 RepID=UPI00380B0AA0
MLYATHALEHTDGDVRQFLTSYLDQQCGLLATTTADHPRALELVGDEELRERLVAVHRRSLRL